MLELTYDENEQYALENIKLTAEEFEEKRWSYIDNLYRGQTPWQKYRIHQKIHNARQKIRTQRRIARGFPAFGDGELWTLLSNKHALYWEHQIIQIPTWDKHDVLTNEKKWIHEMSITECKNIYTDDDIMEIFKSLQYKHAKWAIERLNVVYSKYYNKITKQCDTSK